MTCSFGTSRTMERQAASSWRRSHTPPHSSRRQAAAIDRERHLGAAQRTSPGSATRKRDRAPPEQVWRAYEPDMDPFRRQPLSADASSATIDASTQTEVIADDLGQYGPVHLMSMATIDEVMARLSERKTDLQRQCEEAVPAPEDSEPATTGDEHILLPDDTPVQAPPRSRSYEALVQMEAILEARHRQLMEHGTLDAYARAPAKTRLAMADIQDEIARMHMQLHPRSNAQ
ncbi:hypothetical protein SDRG_07334 [Saprolegnia diclina VS20]|uniref:Uncharacterized protein n=1 Tax=Saprolegnia diclina (strain VS20) TaxID=1156394 RepID=T0QMP8_SAPDV|nr:hypothetical protein SDRG_07334 [Saprolegnia diclina VS20]EQC35100.1 hypothetical protein SDRG_07334 [Saprolegnia diclina VS20]|eukprot:XP_008611384.1 hypothetical protein SDRG_07334 [Saprolegnia diclina VS20]